MVAYQQTGSDNREVCVEIRPNRALSRRALIVLISIPTVVCLTVGITALFWGFWPVLPLAGLEALAVGLGLTLAWRRSGALERIEICEGNLQVTRVVPVGLKRTQQRQFRCPAAWAKVRLARRSHPWHPRRLLIGAHGRVVEIGAFLSDGERKALARRLQQILSGLSAWQGWSPAAADR